MQAFTLEYLVKNFSTALASIFQPSNGIFRVFCLCGANHDISTKSSYVLFALIIETRGKNKAFQTVQENARELHMIQQAFTSQ